MAEDIRMQGHGRRNQLFSAGSQQMGLLDSGRIRKLKMKININNLTRNPKPKPVER